MFPINSENLTKGRAALGSVGVVFCAEGGKVWERAGIREHLGGIDGKSGGLWVALAKLDRPLDTDERQLAMEVLKWCASTGYETNP